jgi:hypothetical protein
MMRPKEPARPLPRSSALAGGSPRSRFHLPCDGGDAGFRGPLSIAAAVGVERVRTIRGGLAEWSKAAVLKTAVRATVPGVRIPHPPPQAPTTSGFVRPIHNRVPPGG